jgi:hypothetical protein
MIMMINNIAAIRLESISTNTRLGLMGATVQISSENIKSKKIHIFIFAFLPK